MRAKWSTLTGNMNLYRTRICLMIAMVIALFITGGMIRKQELRVEAKVSETQQKLAKEVLRFHVLANSDSREDQALKMQVKESILAYMESELPDTGSAEETKAWAREHLGQIRTLAKEQVKASGYDYPVCVKVTSSYFPDKTYGDVTFPEGKYEALRIEIGEAKGQNWWCVLYPNLCFVDATHAVVPKEGKEELEQVLTEEEYEMVTATSKFKIRWFFTGDKE